MEQQGPSTETAATDLGRTVKEWLSFDHVETESDEIRSRARIVAIAALVHALISMIALPIEASMNATATPSPSTWAQFTYVVMLLGVTMVVRLRPAPFASMLVPVVALVGAVALASFEGGFDSPVLLWAPVVPLLAAFAAGPKPAVFAGASMIIVLTGFYAASPASTQHDWVRLVALGDVVLFMTVFAWFYESSRLKYVNLISSTFHDLQLSNADLRMSERRFREVSEALPSVVWLRDAPTGRLVYVNRASLAVWGRSPDELIADPALLMAGVHPEDRWRVQAESFGQPGADPVEVRILREDGGQSWVELSVRTVADTVGDKWTLGVAADVTAQKDAVNLRNRFFEATLEAQEAERQHISRELHDETGQSLAALLMGLRALEGSLDDEAAKATTRELREGVRAIMIEIGRLCRGLRPATLDQVGLRDVLDRLISEYQDTHTETEFTFEVAGTWTGGVPNPLQTAMYRIAQEALTNAIKHANPKHVHLRLEQTALHLSMAVEDDGAGFHVDQIPKERSVGGLGLVGIQERASLLNGRCSIESSPGLGTSVEVQIPVPSTA